MSEDKEIDRIFDLVNKLCWENKWDEINQFLIEADKDCDVCFRLSWLTITSCVKSKLPYRSTFFENTRLMAKTNGSLMEGLQ